MKNLYINTDALVGLYDHSDLLHEQAMTLLEGIAKTSPVLFIGTNILMEALTIIRQRVGKTEAIQLLDELRSSNYTIIHPDDSLLHTAEDFFRTIKSKNISYSDCISFALMQKHNVTWVFSFDEDFKKQGFKRYGFEK